MCVCIHVQHVLKSELDAKEEELEEREKIRSRLILDHSASYLYLRTESLFVSSQKRLVTGKSDGQSELTVVLISFAHFYFCCIFFLVGLYA